MNKWAFFFVCGFLCGLFGAPPVEHHWSLEADYMWMRRTRFPDRVVVGTPVIALTPISGFTPLVSHLNLNKKMTVGDVANDMHGVSGVRFIGSYIHDQANAAEARVYMGFNWTGKKHVKEWHRLYFPFTRNTTDNYQAADKVDGRYDSRFFSVDAAYLLAITPRRINYFSVGWLIGPKFVHIDEKFRLDYTKGIGTSSYTTYAWNKMMGAQTGGWLELNPFSRLTLSINFRIDGFINREKSHVKLTDLDGYATLLNYDEKGTRASYALEFAPVIMYYPTKNLMVRLGYEWFAVHHVALAPSQLQQKRVVKGVLNSRGFVRYESVVAGLALEF